MSMAVSDIIFIPPLNIKSEHLREGFAVGTSGVEGQKVNSRQLTSISLMNYLDGPENFPSGHGLLYPQVP